jgi:hypothetical protein
MTSRVTRYLELERQVDVLESARPRRGKVWPPLTAAFPLLEEMGRLRSQMSPGEKRALARRCVDWEPYSGPFFRAGERVFFEYHCYEADASSDALLWYHTCQYCTVLRPVGRDEKTLYGPNYLVRFDDGVEWEANSDELYKRPFKVSLFRAHNKDALWHRGEGCRLAKSCYGVRLELRCADLEVSGHAEYEATLKRQHALAVFFGQHPELQIGVELVPGEDHQDAYLFFNAGQIPQAAVLLAKLDRPLWRGRRLIYGTILDTPEEFPEDLAKLIGKVYSWRVIRKGYR